MEKGQLVVIPRQSSFPDFNIHTLKSRLRHPSDLQISFIAPILGQRRHLQDRLDGFYMLQRFQALYQSIIQPFVFRILTVPRFVHLNLRQASVRLIFRHHGTAQPQSQRDHHNNGRHADHNTEDRKYSPYLSFPQITAAHPQQIKQFHMLLHSSPAGL